MSPTPSKEKASFTLSELMDKMNYFLKGIADFIDDIGSGKDEWMQIRKKLRMIGMQISELDKNINISDDTLVKQFNELSLETLRTMDLDSFRTRLEEVISKSHLKEKPVTFAAQVKPERKHDMEISAAPSKKTGKKPDKKS